MNTTNQRIQIAAVCGPWKFYPEEDYMVVDNGSRVIMRYYPTEPDDIGRRLDLSGVPDYLNDLNAVREAVATLAGDQRSLYVDNLVLLKEWGDNWSREKIKWREEIKWRVEWFCCHEATAAQRAEAFLRTMKIWRDDAP